MTKKNNNNRKKCVFVMGVLLFRWWKYVIFKKNLDTFSSKSCQIWLLTGVQVLIYGQLQLQENHCSRGVQKMWVTAGSSKRSKQDSEY